jgi:hypothetical protein
LCNIREFLKQCGASVHTGRTEKTIRQKDEFIMKKFLDMDWSTREIEQINRCRLFLNVSRISDIASADGKNVQPEWKKPEGEKNSFSKTCWPKIRAPNESSWKTWDIALKKLTDGQDRLTTPLGRWIVDPKRFRVHRFVYSPSEKRVFERTPGGYVTYKKRGERRRE